MSVRHQVTPFMQSEKGSNTSVISPSWAMVRTSSRSQTHASTLTDLQTTEKWSGPMARRLQALMLEHRLFAVYKHEPDSVQILQTIVEQLCPYFDPPLDHAQIGALVEKTKNKINRIRVELVSQGVLVKTNTGFILAADQPGDPESRESHLQPVVIGLFKEWGYCIPFQHSSFLSKQLLLSLSILHDPLAGPPTVDGS